MLNGERKGKKIKEIIRRWNNDDVEWNKRGKIVTNENVGYR